MSTGSSVGIIYKGLFSPAKAEAERLKAWFEEKGISVFIEEMRMEEYLDVSCGKDTIIPRSVNWVIVLGGDGTLLGAARKVGHFGSPILGVNLGGLGFLTEIPLEGLIPAIELMIEDRLETESRVMLETKILRNRKEVCRFQVLNDVVINKSTLARIIDLDVTINNEFLTTFRADGLIISTPTGSTAYNLAAGGPILYPTMETFILTPICPFTLTNRPIILPDSGIVEIKMGKASEGSVVVTFDGQVGFELCCGDIVIIGTSQKKIRLLKPPDHSYFEILRTKLKWGGATYKKNEDNQVPPTSAEEGH
jgi:NAD+ kinase